MKTLINLFKKGSLIDKIFIVLSPIILFSGIYDIATFDPNNSVTTSAEYKAEKEAKIKEKEETKAKKQAEKKAQAKANQEAKDKKKAEKEAQAKADQEAKDKAKKTESKKEDSSTPPAIKRENLIGTSNKDFEKLNPIRSSTVRNDVTGKWRMTKIYTHEDILKYAKSYYENNFKSDDETHAIVNLTLKTTTCVSKLFDGIISVTIHEYVKGEEHDAKKLFGGMVLGDYWIYLDNGDIEEIK